MVIEDKYHAISCEIVEWRIIGFMISVVCILIFQYIIHPREKIILNILFVILQQTGFDGPMPKINTSHYITLKKKIAWCQFQSTAKKKTHFFCNNYEKRSVFHFINELITRERKRNTHRKKKIIKYCRQMPRRLFASCEFQIWRHISSICSSCLRLQFLLFIHLYIFCLEGQKTPLKNR